MKIGRCGFTFILCLGFSCTPEAPRVPDNTGSATGTGGSGGGNAGSSGGAGNSGTPGGAPGTGGGSGAAGSGGSTGSSGTGGMPGTAGSGGSTGSGGMSGTDGATRTPDGGGIADGRPAPSPDGGARPDAGARPDRGGPSTPDSGTATPPIPPEGFGEMLTECNTPSIDRFQFWTAHANTVPAPGGNILVNEAGQFVAKVRFTGADWGELVLAIANMPGRADSLPGIDLSNSAGLTITYSATALLYVQIRGAVQRERGDQHHVLLPATGGETKSLSFRFLPEDWRFAPLGPPRVTLPDVLKSVVIFNFVGRTANDIVIHGLRLDRYAPACR
jgi:hypothetical protein